MAICEKCGVEFDESEASYQFESDVEASFPVSYECFSRCLCGECAIEEYANGYYYETCEECGKRFFPEEESFSFESQVSHKVMDADMYEHGILCADCAASKLLSEFDDEEDDDDHEGYSVYDAALAWLSHGRDEDYMFGYSEDELESAL